MAKPDSLKRRIYWIASEIIEVMRQRARLLEKQGFEVRFFTNFVGFNTQVEKIRPAIVIIGCGTSDDATLTLMRQITAIPSIRATKMVLTGTHFTQAVTNLASCLNFRDLIPLTADDGEILSNPALDFESAIDPWTQRLLFATAARPKSYTAPAGQLSTSITTDLGVPGRITWISSDRLCLESRARLKAGTEVRIGGAIAASFSAPFIKGVVEKAQNHTLKYHFSGALILKWEPPESDTQNVKTFLQQLRRTATARTVRVFIAVQDTNLRSLIDAQLSGPQFEVATALKRSSIADEPRYFTPDLVVIESKFTKGENSSLFFSMLKSVPAHSKIVILGSDIDSKAFEPFRPADSIQIIPAQTSEALQLNLSRTLTELTAGASGPKEIPKDACYLPTTHLLSEAELLLHGTISRLHPVSISIRAHEPIDRFALVRVINPFLKELFQRYPYCKVTNAKPAEKTYGEKNHAQDLEGYFADLNAHEISLLSKSLWLMFTQHFTKYLPDKDAQAISDWTKDTSQSPVFSWDILNSISLQSLSIAISLPVDSYPKEESPKALESESEKKNDKATSLRKTLVRTKATPSEQRFSEIIKAIMIVVGAGIFLWALYSWLAPRISHSGGIYSDQLKKFAPHLNQSQEGEP